MFIAWRATTKKDEGATAGVGDLVPCTGRDGDRIARTDGGRFPINAHLSDAVEDVVDFLGFDVMVRCRRAAGRQTRFGQRLIADTGIARGQQLAYLRTILGGKGRYAVEIAEIHEIAPNLLSQEKGIGR
jgi:hypothetical protein